MFLSKLGLRNPASAQKGENFLGVRVGMPAEAGYKGCEDGWPVVMLVFRECL
jgi:hypothetical protein